MSPPALHCLVSSSRAYEPTGDGPLTGVRIVVKDCIALDGHRSSFGHARWRETHGPAGRDAEVVARLRQAGAGIVGLAKLDQLAYSVIGNAGEGEPPVNRHDPACFCGGSSSGSASAVAGGIAELGVGTDTGGSVRVPAAACGLYGLRPTHGRVSADGVIPLAASLDVVGFLAAEPEVIGRALAAAGPPARPRALGRVISLGAADGAARVADALGVTARFHELSDLVNPQVGELMARIQGREIWAAHGPWIAEHSSALAEDVRLRLRRCRSLSGDPAQVVEADLRARDRYREAVRALVGEDGVVVAPVRPWHGPRRTGSDAQLRAFRAACFELAAPSSLSGLPQLALAPDAPAPGSPGTGLIGPPGSEEALLDLAQRLRR